MEAVRPQVDIFLLELLRKRTFRVADFFENRQGVCRVLPAALRRLTAEGRDPAHGGGAGRMRGASNARRQREVASWDRAHPNRPDPEVFKREILPNLQEVSLGRIARATGLTRMYCSLIRRGLCVPHARHWDTLAEVGGKIRETAPRKRRPEEDHRTLDRCPW